MNKIKNILIWLTIITYLIVSLSFVSTKEKASICSKIEINIVDNTENQFVEEQEIINIMLTALIQIKLNKLFINILR